MFKCCLLPAQIGQKETVIPFALINEENIKNNNADLDRNTTAPRVLSNIFAGIGHGLQTEMNAAGEVQALIKKVRDSLEIIFRKMSKKD